MKTYYTEITHHCLRFWARYKGKEFKSSADKNKWDAVEKIMQNEKYAPFATIFLERDTLGDNIYNYAYKNNLNQNTLWANLADLEKEIAIELGLIGG